MKPTSVGTLMINDALPEELRLKGKALDKTELMTLLRGLADGHPEKYKSVLKVLNDVGRSAAYTEGVSVSLSALRKSPRERAIIDKVRQAVAGIRADPDLDDKARDAAVIKTVLPMVDDLQGALKEEGQKENNPYWFQVKSGARGKLSDFNSIRGAQGLVDDHRNRPVPIPILHSYAEGLDPVEYWAGTYGQRRGAIDVKFQTGDSGFLNKQLVNAAHRIIVNKERPAPTRLPVGLPTKVADRDNIGAVLAADAGGHLAGTLITSDIHADLEDQGVEDILIHSPMTEATEDGGVSRWAAGRRGARGLSPIGENLGIPAAQSFGEKLSQATLNSKHKSGSSGGTNAKNLRQGFQYLNRLIQAPEHFPEAGPLTEEDGTVTEISKAPQGGHYVHVGDNQYYIQAELNPVVAKGDTLEAGDDLSDGVPHPEQLVRLRGIGEARRVYSDLFQEAMKGSGVEVHRRNAETVVAGLLNWAKVTDPDEIVPHHTIAAHYEPREGSELVAPGVAVGKYLEEPALHYTPGTRVTKRVKKDLDAWKIKDIRVHREAPGFQPYMQRGMLGVHSDPDWQTRLSGFYTTSAFTEAVHRGRESDPNSTSFVPALVRGQHFGTDLKQKGSYGVSQAASPSAPSR
jgi:DNA-directed RNA polymerase subunit beta'